MSDVRFSRIFYCVDDLRSWWSKYNAGSDDCMSGFDTDDLEEVDWDDYLDTHDYFAGGCWNPDLKTMEEQLQLGRLQVDVYCSWMMASDK